MLRDPLGYERFQAFVRTERESPALCARRLVVAHSWAPILAPAVADAFGLPRDDQRPHVYAAMVLAAMELRGDLLAESILAGVERADDRAPGARDGRHGVRAPGGRVRGRRPARMIERRLHAQLLSGPGAASAVDVTERLLAVQAQDARGARLAIRARTRGLTVADVDRELGERSLLVTWLNRGTLHLVRREDYPWLQLLTTPPIVSANARRLEQEGVPPAAGERAVAAIVRALGRSGPADARAAARDGRRGRCRDRGPGAGPRPDAGEPARADRPRPGSRRRPGVRPGPRLAGRAATCRSRPRAGRAGAALPRGALPGDRSRPRALGRRRPARRAPRARGDRRRAGTW